MDTFRNKYQIDISTIQQNAEENKNNQLNRTNNRYATGTQGSSRRNIRSFMSPTTQESPYLKFQSKTGEDFFSSRISSDNKNLFDISEKVPNVFQSSEIQKRDFTTQSYKPFSANPFGTLSRKSCTLSDTLEAETSKSPSKLNIYSIEVANTELPNPKQQRKVHVARQSELFYQQNDSNRLEEETENDSQEIDEINF